MKTLFITCLFIVYSTVFSLKSVAQPDTLSFLHITDLHLIFNPDLHQQDLAQSRKHYAQGQTPLKQFLQTMPEKTNSSMVIATGDLVDSYETEAKDGKMVSFPADQFMRVVGKSKVPVYLTLGNHDISSYTWENNARRSNQNNTGQSRARWIRNIPCFKNGTYYSQIHQVGKTTYRLIFLDNGFYRFLPGENVSVPYIDKPQVYWLMTQLQQSNNDIEIILMHLPLTTAATQPESSNEIYPVLAKNPSAKLILAGHNHKNAMQDFASGEDKKMVQVQTGAFAQDKENWRVIRLTENAILVSVPGNTKNELTIPVN
ncbi:MAG: hypothetical protein A2W90_15095 [Bacteroidetes bacterium GWF2_42_66]|nr:MAG: hypothetical protein A2W92_15375 [Bacteroidetes bacterium GWA2_42_15]OFX99799.1 MAG: hypothetical protein A2W89_07135 [Bacteroidetes bacterium GWE2_42_39]OFY46637.1 MAG: hypothetical protein A2W90_15095 [Bacteroidetes bacterium GWF2_42_66]HBL74761.1 hypothetical protein [Prolixibacteraceae bacterium]HCR90963.1 hypothetical protein [Prolixibacteraceae bacterium]